MVLSNVERQQRYRDNNKEKINEKKRLTRKNIRGITKCEEIKEEIKIEDYDVKDTEKIVQKHKLNKSLISDDSINVYIKSIKKLYRIYNKEELDETEIKKLLNNDKTTDHNKIKKQMEFIILNIEDINLNYKTDVKYLYAINLRVKYNKKIKDILTILNETLKEKYEDTRNDKYNYLNQYKEIVTFKKEEILKNVDKLEKREDKLLYLLMMLVPNKRMNEYTNMQIIKNEDEMISKSINYLKNDIMYINKTKNKKKINFKIPKEIIEYIDYNKSILLEGKTSNLLMKYIMINKAIYNIGLTNTEMRHLYSSYINSRNINISDHQNISKIMGHSIDQNRKYAIL